MSRNAQQQGRYQDRSLHHHENTISRLQACAVVHAKLMSDWAISGAWCRRPTKRLLPHNINSLGFVTMVYVQSVIKLRPIATCTDLNNTRPASAIVSELVLVCRANGPAIQGRRSPGLLLVRAWWSFVITCTFPKHNGSPCAVIVPLLSRTRRHRHAAHHSVYIRLPSVPFVTHLRISIFTPCVFRLSLQASCLALRPQPSGSDRFKLVS